MKCAVRLSSALIVTLSALGLAGSASASTSSICKSPTADLDSGRVVLVSSATKVSSGEHVVTQLQNGLNRPIGIGRRYIQRYIEGSWSVVMPSTPSSGAAPVPDLRRERLAAGTAGKCLSFEVTEEFSPGRYRVVNEVYLSLRSGAKPRKRLAEFRVR